VDEPGPAGTGGRIAIDLSVLPAWMTVALDPTSAARHIEREVDAHIGRHPHLAGLRLRLIERLTAASTLARQEAAVLGAIRFEEHPVLGASEASMAGWMLTRNPARSVDDEIADNLARFAVQHRLDRSPPRVTHVQLAVGSGLRVETTRAEPIGTHPGTRQPPQRAVEYHLPLTTPPSSLLLVRFTTSDLAQVATVVGELDAIVADIRLLPA
jgi:hypothetical protein